MKMSLGVYLGFIHLSRPNHLAREYTLKLVELWS